VPLTARPIKGCEIGLVLRAGAVRTALHTGEIAAHEDGAARLGKSRDLVTALDRRGPRPDSRNTPGVGLGETVDDRRAGHAFGAAERYLCVHFAAYKLRA